MSVSGSATAFHAVAAAKVAWERNKVAFYDGSKSVFVLD